MGWSHSAKAGKVLEAWENACVNSTGKTNTWKEDNIEFFFETSRTEHASGAITGSIQKIENNLAYLHGSFRIEGDGTITRAPAFLKKCCEFQKHLI
jgi:hypothetical protein